MWDSVQTSTSEEADLHMRSYHPAHNFLKALESFEIKGTLSGWTPEETELIKCPSLKPFYPWETVKRIQDTWLYFADWKGPVSKCFAASIVLARKMFPNIPSDSLKSWTPLHRRMSLRGFPKGVRRQVVKMVPKPVMFWIHWVSNYCPLWARQINLGPLHCLRRNKGSVKKKRGGGWVLYSCMPVTLQFDFPGNVCEVWVFLLLTHFWFPDLDEIGSWVENKTF